MHAISSYCGNRPTNSPTNTHIHTQNSDRTDYNTLRRSFASAQCNECDIRERVTQREHFYTDACSGRLRSTCYSRWRRFRLMYIRWGHSFVSKPTERRGQLLLLLLFTYAIVCAVPSTVHLADAFPFSALALLAVVKVRRARGLSPLLDLRPLQ